MSSTIEMVASHVSAAVEAIRLSPRVSILLSQLAVIVAALGVLFVVLLAWMPSGLGQALFPTSLEPYQLFLKEANDELESARAVVRDTDFVACKGDLQVLRSNFVFNFEEFYTEVTKQYWLRRVTGTPAQDTFRVRVVRTDRLQRREYPTGFQCKTLGPDSAQATYDSTIISEDSTKGVGCYFVAHVPIVTLKEGDSISVNMSYRFGSLGDRVRAVLIDPRINNATNGSQIHVVTSTLPTFSLIPRYDPKVKGLFNLFSVGQGYFVSSEYKPDSGRYSGKRVICFEIAPGAKSPFVYLFQEGESSNRGI